MNKLIEIYGIKPLRLYEFNVDKNKFTGKKRDYANMETFLKYGIDTFKRYNESPKWNGENSIAKLCFLNESGKYQQIPTELILKNILPASKNTNS